MKNKAQKWVFAALVDITETFPFPVKGIDSDNGGEFINGHLLRWCNYQKVTFTRSRAGRKNDGAHVEQKKWSVVRRAVGYHRCDTARNSRCSTTSTRLGMSGDFISWRMKSWHVHRSIRRKCVSARCGSWGPGQHWRDKPARQFGCKARRRLGREDDRVIAHVREAEIGDGCHGLNATGAAEILRALVPGLG